MQVIMTMEEYEDLTFKNKRVIEELKETYSSEMLAMQNRAMLEIRKLRSDKEKLESKINNEGCEFCNDKKEITLEKGLDIGLLNNKLNFYFDTCACGYFEDELKINYCPMCGKRLEV